MWVAVLLKWVTVSALTIVGASMLLSGLGVTMPYMKILGVEAYEIPSAVLLLLCAAWVARSWRLRSQHEITETTRVSEPVAGQIVTIERTRTDRSTFTATQHREDKGPGD